MNDFNIQEKVTEVLSYFKYKILNNEFVFEKCSEHTATIKIDDKFIFKIWIGNGAEHVDFYDTSPFLESLNLSFKTQKERKEVWGNLNPHIESYRALHLKREKQKEINRLQKELDNLTKTKQT